MVPAACLPLMMMRVGKLPLAAAGVGLTSMLAR